MCEKNEKLLNTYKIEYLCVHSERLSWESCSSFHYPHAFNMEHLFLFPPKTVQEPPGPSSEQVLGIIRQSVLFTQSSQNLAQIFLYDPFPMKQETTIFRRMKWRIGSLNGTCSIVSVIGFTLNFQRIIKRSHENLFSCAYNGDLWDSDAYLLHLMKQRVVSW